MPYLTICLLHTILAGQLNCIIFSSFIGVLIVSKINTQETYPRLLQASKEQGFVKIDNSCNQVIVIATFSILDVLGNSGYASILQYCVVL